MARTKEFDRTDRRIAVEMAKGRCDHEIAALVPLSVGGIKYRLSNLMNRTGVSNRTALAARLVADSFFDEEELKEICDGCDISIC